MLANGASVVWNRRVSSFTTRVISALVAVAILFALWFYLQLTGLKILSAFAVIVGTLELIRMLFKPDDSRFVRAIFYVFTLCLFGLASLHPFHTGVIFACFSAAFCLITLLSQQKFDDLKDLTNFQAKSVLGFFYMGLLPSFAIRLLDLEHGQLWFITLLAIVFAGDIGAYLTGMTIGKHKLMPMISPKKTIEGSLGGLVFSVVVGGVMATWLEKPIYPLAILALATGVIAQFGDLFESQLKRVADIKDSGKIMPGHGGVLDRIDGVLFACPVILLGALILENQFV